MNTKYIWWYFPKRVSYSCEIWYMDSHRSYYVTVKWRYSDARYPLITCINGRLVTVKVYFKSWNVLVKNSIFFRLQKCLEFYSLKSKSARDHVGAYFVVKIVQITWNCCHQGKSVFFFNQINGDALWQFHSIEIPL